MAICHLHIRAISAIAALWHRILPISALILRLLRKLMQRDVAISRRLAWCLWVVPKALVDSERILTRLRAEGYAISPGYSGAEAVIVNTCGFLDSAKAESLDAIGEALTQNGKVIVTGCLGAEPDYIREHHPKILAVTGPQQYEQVLDAVHSCVPPDPDPFIDLLPATGVSADTAALQLSQDIRGL